MLAKISPSPGLDEDTLALSIMAKDTGSFAWFSDGITIAVLAPTWADVNSILTGRIWFCAYGIAGRHETTSYLYWQS